MSRSYNYNYYNEEETKKGLPLKFVASLQEENKQSDFYCNDIHMYMEEGATIVEWVRREYSSDEYTGRFRFVDIDERVLKEYHMPDGTWMEFETKREYEEYLIGWLREHPEYEMNEYGVWVIKEDKGE